MSPPPDTRGAPGGTGSPDRPPAHEAARPSLSLWLARQALFSSMLLSGIVGTAVAVLSALADGTADGAVVWLEVALGAFGANLLLSAVLTLTVHRAVTRPLAALETAIKAAGAAAAGMEREGVGQGLPPLPPGTASDLAVPPGLSRTEIGRVVRSFLDRMDGLVRSHAQLSLMVRRDHLTRLPNRVCIAEALDAALKRARTADTRVALLYLDLDRFKHINDSLGHAAGDELLRLVAARLRSLCPDPDAIARMGGDEFLILLDAVDDRAKVIRLAEALLAEIARPFRISGHAVHVNTSIGISLWPRDGSDGEQLMRSADAAMYAAKAAGAGTWRFFSREMRERSLAWLRTEASLREALEFGRFELFYQPKVIAGTGALYGMEALLRWRHEGRHVSPTEFIHIAEDTGLIIPIGAWVLRTACAQAACWGRSHGPLQIAVNVSARQLRSREFAGTVRAVLEETGLEAARLTLEITESMLMDDVGAALEALSVLRAIGVGIAVDDFGTGYSSLAYLRRFPITQLKIDRSFIKDLPLDTAISETVMTLAAKLNLQCVAEGVETAQQYEWLRQSGCHLVQGYHVSVPLPARDFEQRFVLRLAIQD